jgi:hypothetical protein
VKADLEANGSKGANLYQKSPSHVTEEVKEPLITNYPTFRNICKRKDRMKEKVEDCCAHEHLLLIQIMDRSRNALCPCFASVVY